MIVADNTAWRVFAEQAASLTTGRARQLWNEMSLSRIDVALQSGFLVMKSPRPTCAYDDEFSTFLTYRGLCYERRIPFVLLLVCAKSCEIVVDMDSCQRDRTRRMGGMTSVEAKMLSVLMSGYRKVLAGSPIIRQWGRIPLEDGPGVARIAYLILEGGNYR